MSVCELLTENVVEVTDAMNRKDRCYLFFDRHSSTLCWISPTEKKERVWEVKKHKIKQTVSEAGRQKDHSATQTVISPLDSQGDLCK